MKRSRSNRRQRGFTIVEIIVVVIIIGALATMIMPKIFGRVGQAKQSVAMQKVTEIEKAIDMFCADYQRLPDTLGELVTRPEDIAEEKWNPPTLKTKDLLDPWEREFVYTQPGENGPYDLVSYGRDGQPGGEKEDADVTNW